MGWELMVKGYRGCCWCFRVAVDGVLGYIVFIGRVKDDVWIAVEIDIARPSWRRMAGRIDFAWSANWRVFVNGSIRIVSRYDYLICTCWTVSSPCRLCWRCCQPCALSGDLPALSTARPT